MQTSYSSAPIGHCPWSLYYIATFRTLGRAQGVDGVGAAVPVPRSGGGRRADATPLRRPVVRDVRRVGGGELRGAVLLPVRRGGLPHAGPRQGAVRGGPAVRGQARRRQAAADDQARRRDDAAEDEPRLGPGRRPAAGVAPAGADGAVRAERKQDRREPGRTGGAASAAPPGDASVDAISAVGEGSGRARPRVDAAEKTWVEIYQLGHWGFGRLSFSQPQVIRGDTGGNDGVAASRQ